MANYTRQMSQTTKNKISRKMLGRKLSNQTKQKISNAIKKAWASVPQTTTSTLWSCKRENNDKNTNLKNENN